MRRLAAVAVPEDGEAFGSWVDRVAAGYGKSAGNAARWLGLDCRVGVGGSVAAKVLWGGVDAVDSVWVGSVDRVVSGRLQPDVPVAVRRIGVGLHWIGS